MTASYASFVGALLILVGMHTSAVAADDPPGKMALLPGYVHEPLQGIDSKVGKISKPKGLTIQYEIGRVPKPGGFALGGDFSDRPKAVPEADRLWYKEQRIADQPVHLALSKSNGLLVSYPDSGVNFHVAVKNPEEMADALLIILSYRGEKKE